MGTWTTTPRTWVAGEIPTAAMFNANLRDFGRAFSDAFTSWTPTLTQSATVTNTPTAYYMQVGKLVIAYAHLAVTGAGTATNIIESTMPVTPAAAYRGAGSWWHYDDTNTNYTGHTLIASTSKLRFQKNADNNYHGKNSGTLSNLDMFEFIVVYEAA